MRMLLLALCLAAPVPASALSCLVPEVERSFATYDAAEENYIVVHGRLTLDRKAMPEGMTTSPPPPEMTVVPGHLSGSSLTGDGFSLPFEQDVTLEVACIGPWCGGVGNGEDVLAFVRKDADGYALSVNPCGGALFETPKLEMLKQVEACMVSRDCKAD